MNNYELKPPVGAEDNFGIAFKINKGYNGYSISCHIIERGKYMQRYCASGIQEKQFAKYILDLLKSRWNIYNKILRFSDVPKNINLTPYCELHSIEDLKKFEKEYLRLKKIDLEMSKKFEIQDEVRKLSQKIKIIQEKIEELKK